MKGEQTHYIHLHEFIKPKNLRPVLKDINRSLDELVSVIIEPEYYHNRMEHYSMPDYMFRFEDGVWLPGEMKGSKHQAHKAKSQLQSGKTYCEDLFNYSPQLGLFVMYDVGLYKWHFYEI